MLMLINIFLMWPSAGENHLSIVSMVQKIYLSAKKRDGRDAQVDKFFIFGENSLNKKN